MMHNGDAAVAFFYVRHNDPFLKQGEIVNNLFELKLQITEQKSIDDVRKDAKFDPIVHPYVIVVSQDCDLEWDYKARLGDAPEEKLLTHILFCALFTQAEVRSRSGLTHELWKRARQNQDEREHRVEESLRKVTEEMLPEWIADFKTTFSLPNEFAYWLVSTSQAIRKGALSSPYLEDFMHRLYSFLGRVATL